MEKLTKNFEDIKIILESPRLHQENFFIDLKAEVDLAFAKKWNNENEGLDRIKEELILIVRIIEIFREKCLKISNIDFKRKLSIMLGEKIQMIEQQLNDSKSNDASNLLKIGTEIEEIQNEIKKTLFSKIRIL